MEHLKTYLTYAGVSETDLTKMANFFTLKEMRKGDLFAREGKISSHLAFIEQGVFQYFYNKDGTEITSYVTGENTFLASLASFLQQKPARESIRALSAARVWMIHKKQIEEMLRESDSFKTFYVQLLEHQIVCIDNSRTDFILLNAEQRYEKMLREEPHLLQQIPLQYLASMLGVTPRHLSRIRGNIR